MKFATDSGAKSINHHGRQPITTHETQPVYRISGPLSKNDVYRLQAPTTVSKLTDSFSPL